MKLSAPLLVAILTVACNSCYYRNRVPVSSPQDPNPKLVTMKVGERKKVQSKTILTEISPGFMLGPSTYLKSSDAGILVIEGKHHEPVAWVRAVAPGRANIEYADDGLITPVVVTMDGE